ncbi:MAG: double-strand break repair protein AddB [Hyphomicrobium sp.]
MAGRDQSEARRSAEATGQGRACVYTVPTGRGFLVCLARAILAGDLPAPGGRPPSPIELAGYTLLLPTRRATRAVQEAFLTASGGKAMLLPRVLPIAEGQEDLGLIAEAAVVPSALAETDDIPPAIGEMERLLTLTQMVMRWAEAERTTADDDAGYLSDRALSPAGNTPAQAAQLAAELARLMDMVETESVSYAGLATLVPAEHTEQWKKTLEFLSIVTTLWPAVIAERDVTSAADRRNRIILAEARRLTRLPPAGPVIVAGVTGSVPATAELMRAVAALPLGAIVLPGLDTRLDDTSWDAIATGVEGTPGHPEHPQYGLQKLLTNLGIDRRAVRVLSGAELSPAQLQREQLISETLRPASTTGRWADLAADLKATPLDRSLDGVNLIEAPSGQDEAEAIALILREAANTPGRTAALVSPDRLLARRVAVRLEGWGIRVDDSAGRPFRKTVPGAFLDLVIEAAAENFSPASVTGLLNHPLARLGLDPFAIRRAARALEIAAFRGPYLGEGLAGIDAALERAASDAKPGSGRRPHAAVRRLWDDDWTAARDLVRRLADAYKPLTDLMPALSSRSDTARRPLAEFAAVHLAAAEAVARLPDAEAPAGEGESSAPPRWQGEAGVTARRFFDALFVPDLPQPEIRVEDYPDLYRALLASENVRPRVPVHPRLFIWGPFEARLQQTDVMVLGSLNDGTWPEAADPGPWLNRSMRKALGLPSPEERIGHAAHDFTSFFGAERVVLTRALKVDGVPTVPSRWLMRLKALLGGLGLSDRLTADRSWLGWARSRDDVARTLQLPAPSPRPPLELRPRKLSVSRVETWIANPYAIFAREILQLAPMPPLGEAPGPALRGTIVHAALAAFAKRHPGALPADLAGELLQLARAEFADLKAHPRVAAFWVPRFARFAEWFAETEPARRGAAATVVAETSGRLVIEAPAGPFELTARADRVDVGSGGVVITDYKTGQPPSSKAVMAGFKPQLPLEAAIAEGGHFAHVPAGAVDGLRYIGVSGGEPPGTERMVSCPDHSVLARDAVSGLARLVAAFDDVATPYAPKRRSGFSYEFDEFAHLARVAEWSADSGSGEED